MAMNMNASALRPGATLAYVMLVTVMLLWASGVIVARAVHDLAPPVGFSFWRWFVAVVVLTPLAARALWRERQRLRAQLGHLLLLGLFIAGGSTLLVWSVQFTTATNAALVSAAQPMVTVLMAWLIIRERLRKVQLAGVVFAAAGIVIMVVRMDLAVLLSLDFNPGDLLVLLAVVFYALYAINLHRWLPGLGALLMMYLTGLGGIFVLLPCYLAESLWVTPFTAHPVVLGAVVFMALVPTLLATTMWNISVGVVGPSRASVFINLLPIFGTVLAWWLLDEQIAHYHVLGGVLVCFGITLVVREAAR